MSRMALHNPWHLESYVKQEVSIYGVFDLDTYILEDDLLRTTDVNKYINQPLCATRRTLHKNCISKTDNEARTTLQRNRENVYHEYNTVRTKKSNNSTIILEQKQQCRNNKSGEKE